MLRSRSSAGSQRPSRQAAALGAATTGSLDASRDLEGVTWDASGFVPGAFKVGWYKLKPFETCVETSRYSC